MKSAFIIGGTRFIGRHAVNEFLDNEYTVTIFNRGRSTNPFEDDDRIRHIQGDREKKADLEAAASSTDPDVVIDSYAYHPPGVRAAIDVFSEVSAYVYVSSAAAYSEQVIPLRED
jgi:nucleoside-diphosphate-sugar epimerase